MAGLHIPDYTPHVCVPTKDAYDAACRALEHHKAELGDLTERLAALSRMWHRGGATWVKDLDAVIAGADPRDWATNSEGRS